MAYRVRDRRWSLRMGQNALRVEERWRCLHASHKGSFEADPDLTSSYIDDMAVGSCAWLIHWIHVRQFLLIMRDAGITLNVAKCDIGNPK